MLKIAFNKLGPITKGNNSISLDQPIIVLVGPNGTGKSLVSYLLYSILKDLSNPKFLINSSYAKHPNYYKQLIKSDEGSYKIEINRFRTIINRTESYLDHFKRLSYQESAFMGKPNLSGLQVSVDWYSKFTDLFPIDIETNVSHDLKITRKTDCVLFNLNYESYAKGELLEKIMNDIYLYLRQADVFFLPAERSTLSYFYKTIVSSLLISTFTSQGVQIQRRKVARPISDYLLFLNEYSITSSESTFKELLIELSDSISGINFTFDSESGFGYFVKTNESQIDSHLVSFNAKSLMGLYHKINSYQDEHLPKYLFIDEPETHLHPDAQVKLARWLCKLPKFGIRLIISTHSDYILREFNNMILLNNQQDEQIKKSIMDEFNIDNDSLISSGDIKPYLFHNSMVQPVDVDDEGFGIETIDRQLDETEKLINSLYA